MGRPTKKKAVKSTKAIVPRADVHQARDLVQAGLGGVMTQMIDGQARECLVTYVSGRGHMILTPIPDGMTAHDFGRRFWASITVARDA